LVSVLVLKFHEVSDEQGGVLAGAVLEMVFEVFGVEESDAFGAPHLQALLIDQTIQTLILLS
jgi:hypothetical protein